MTQNELMKVLHLSRPAGRVSIVLDTDAYNEIDDQYAIAYALNSHDKLDVLAIYAAPFYATPFFPPMNDMERATSPADGMKKSYTEILNVLDLMDRHDMDTKVFMGSARYMEKPGDIVPSDAACDLVEKALAMKDGERLYVVTIGAITNVAAAIQMNPAILDKIVVVWLGGNAPWWADNAAFNCMQDTLSARTVFDSGVPLVHIPAMGVTSHLLASGAELRESLCGKNKLCDYLYQCTENWAHSARGTTNWSKTLWDISAIAWLVGDDSWMHGHLVHSPIITQERTYSHATDRHFINEIQYVMRDKILDDLFPKLAK
jgi:Inosine-uridine nucleoside N-ribohydrolase